MILKEQRSFTPSYFGWKIEKYSGPIDYWLISTTTPSGEKGVDSGMMQRQNPQQPIIVYIDVPSVDEYAAAKVEKLGGKVVVSKMAVQV